MTRDLPDVLRRIVERRLQALDAAPPLDVELPAPRRVPLQESENSFLAAVGRERGHAVIAEVKLGSPRIGTLVGKIDPESQAAMYARAGAAALSVVVEPSFFFGSYDLLVRCRRAADLPTLAKDFVLDERQLLWARAAGATAVLLLARLMEAERLMHLAGLARGLGLAPLVETHDAEDLAKLRGERWECVGVNHRDLRSFEVDLERSAPLMAQLPEGALRIAESGIATPSDVAQLRRQGFDAYLIGESLLLSEHPSELLRELSTGASGAGR